MLNNAISNKTYDRIYKNLIRDEYAEVRARKLAAIGAVTIPRVRVVEGVLASIYLMPGEEKFNKLELLKRITKSECDDEAWCLVQKELNMGNLSKHLSRDEIACKCGCGFDDIKQEVVELFEEVRWMNGDVPIKPSSGCRCPEHNKVEGGSDKSQHMKGTAIDIPCRDPKYIYNYLDTKYPRKYGIGLYKNFIHIDTRETRARWQS